MPHCPRCGHNKLPGEFGRDSSVKRRRLHGGRAIYCRACARQQWTQAARETRRRRREGEAIRERAAATETQVYPARAWEVVICIWRGEIIEAVVLLVDEDRQEALLQAGSFRAWRPLSALRKLLARSGMHPARRIIR